jgi:hypothetical protein
MVSDGIKAAQIQARHSPLNSSWGSGSSPAAVFASAIRSATVLFSAQSDGQRQPMGRHAGSVKTRSSTSNHVPKHAAA